MASTKSMFVYDLCEDGDDDDNLASSIPQNASTIRATPACSWVLDDTFYVEIDDDDDDVLVIEDCKPATVKRSDNTFYVDDDDSVEAITDCKPAAAKRSKTDSTTTKTTDSAALTTYDKPFTLSDDREQHDDDYAIAAALQQQVDDEDERLEQRQRKALQQMQCSTTGKAWKFVESVLDLLKQMNFDDYKAPIMSSAPIMNMGNFTWQAPYAPATVDSAGNPLPPPHPKYCIQPLAVNNMVFFAERFFDTQDEFRAAGKPIVVNLGYHHTYATNLESIRTDGLMSKAERTVNNIKEAVYHGSSYGDGIYSATDPIAYSGHGDMGLLVARLPGESREFVRPHAAIWSFAPQASRSSSDSVYADAHNKGGFMVLAKAKQCLPILQFPLTLVWNSFGVSAPGLDALKAVHRKIQDLVNATFLTSQKVNASMDASRQLPTNIGARTPSMAPMARQNIKKRKTLHGHKNKIKDSRKVTQRATDL